MPEPFDTPRPDETPETDINPMAVPSPDEVAEVAVVTPHDEDITVGLSTRARRTALFLSVVLLLIPVTFALSGNIELLAQNFLQQFTNRRPEAVEVELKAAPVRKNTGAFILKNHPLHPDNLYQPYFGQPLSEVRATNAATRMIPGFRDWFGVYVQRQAEDDNFTIRVLDGRSNKELEVYELKDERMRYQERGWADWARIDGLRRSATNDLVKKYTQRGVPKASIVVKWGRRNQVLEAHERDLPFLEYELRLADYLGLSLLATEIGLVETFNQDKLVSTVGARSRYQMMPYNLRQNGIHQYELPTASGSRVPVYEEWHTLLTMEPAFTLLRGYINAVGHEVPGISAYHTGPGNLFKIYRMYLTEIEQLSPETSVMDAYVWAVTDGYPEISSQTSFKGYSRGYVASGYGALRATEGIPIDTTQTVRTERVQVAPGQRIYLSALLRALDESGAALPWDPAHEAESLYERFRALNPHIVLPDGTDGGGVPSRGDVLLTAQSGDIPVRFFLPLGATEVLAEAGVNALDPSATFRFDQNAYRLPPTGVVTIWDRQYEDLLADIRNFGFSMANRQRLVELKNRFQQLAAENPTHYRKTQLQVIRTHLNLWSYDGWEQLANATTAARGAYRLPVRPPSQLETVLTPTLRPPVDGDEAS